MDEVTTVPPSLGEPTGTRYTCDWLGPPKCSYTLTVANTPSMTEWSTKVMEKHIQKHQKKKET